jgi:hypothetical protein
MARFKYFLFAAAAFGYFLYAVDPSSLFEKTLTYIFQARDLARGEHFAAGFWIHYGPEMTGGGHLPGPLYYLLLAVPSALGGSWEWVWGAMIVFAGVGAVAGWQFLRSELSLPAAWLWLALFALSSNTTRMMIFFMNISFILPLVVVMTVAVGVALSHDDPARRKRAVYWCAFLSGLALQLHFSSIVPLVALLLAQLFARRLGLHKVSLRTLANASLFFLASLMPFILGEILSDSGFAGSGFNALPSLFYLTKFTAEVPADFLLSSAWAKFVAAVPWILLPLAVTWLAVPSERGTSPLLRAWLVCGAVAMVPFSYYFFASIGVRYGSPFGVALYFLAAVLFQRVTRSSEGTLVFCVLTGVALVLSSTALWMEYTPMVINLGAVAMLITLLPLLHLLLVQRKREEFRVMGALALAVALTVTQNLFFRTGRFNEEPRLMPTLSQWREIWTHVYRHTGWSYETASRRMFFVNHHLEQAGQISYQHFVKKLPPPKDTPADPDGFIVSSFKDSAGMEPKATKRWLLNQNIPQLIKENLINGNLELGEPLPSAQLIVPYRVKAEATLPKHFHNTGQGYMRSATDELLDQIEGAEGVRILDKGRILFKWNECKDQPRFCATGALVTLTPNKATVLVIGSAISQVSPWISPNWTERWEKPFLGIECDGRETKYEIADGIGYSREYAATAVHPLLWGNNSLVAPFEREFRLNCRRSPTGVSVGRAGSKVETLYKIQQLPARRLALHL